MKQKQRLYETLKEKMKGKDIDQQYLAELLDRSPGYITSRMTGRGWWTMAEMYKIMELINCPADQLHVIFPKDGVKPKSKPPMGEVVQCLNVGGKLYQLPEVGRQ